MSDPKRVVIIGGGIMGLSCAYYLAQRDYQITIVDRGEPTTQNCSFGNAGYVTPSHIVPLAAPGMMMMGLKWMRDPESPFYVRPRLAPDLISWGWQFFRAGTKAHVQRSAPLLCQLNMASRACFEELDDQLGDFDFAKNGMMMLCKTQHTLDEEAEVAQLAQSLGLQAEVLDARQTQERNPNVKLEACGAVYFADDCHMAPHKLMARLQEKLAAQNVNFIWNTEVTGWKRGSQKIHAALTSEGGIEGDEFVLCGGSWSTSIVRELALKIPLQAGKGYSLTLPQPHSQPAMPTIFVERRVAVTPMGNQLRFAGTMEIAGLNTNINPARIRGIKKSVPLYFPEFSDADFVGVQPWVGLRPCSPDGLPYVGRTARFSNLSIGAGHAMLGLSLGPITGLLLSQAISGEPLQVESPMLNPDRYG